MVFKDCFMDDLIKFQGLFKQVSNIAYIEGRSDLDILIQCV